MVRIILSCLKAVTHTADTQQLVSSRVLPMQTSLHLVSFPNLYFVEPHLSAPRKKYFPQRLMKAKDCSVGSN